MSPQQLPPLPKPAIANGPGSMFRFNYYNADQMRDYARAALAANVPAGFVLVPVEPTPEMRKAFHAANAEAEAGTPLGSSAIDSPDHQWAAMLAAAPAPEADPCIYPACQTNGCREACKTEPAPKAAPSFAWDLSHVHAAGAMAEIAQYKRLAPAQAQQSYDEPLELLIGKAYRQAEMSDNTMILRADFERGFRAGYGVKPEAQQPKPLTDEQIEGGRSKLFSVGNPYCPITEKAMRTAVRWAERCHGIGAGGEASK